MKKVDQIAKEISELSPEELANFRAWYMEFDAAAWDEQIASDVRRGALDDLMREAKNQYDSGESTEI